MRHSFSVIKCILALLIFLSLSCGGKKQENRGGGKEVSQTAERGSRENAGRGNGRGHKLINPYTTNISQVLEESGEIAPITTAEIKSRISGRVIAINVHEGDYVKKGKIIASIEPDLSQAKTITSLINGLRKAEIDLSQAESAFVQKKGLYDEGFISENEYKAAEDALNIAEMNYNASKEEYDLFKNELGEEGESVKMDTLNVISPISGIILKREVEEGELISGESSSKSGTLLFTVADLSRLVIKIDVNEVDIYKLDIGQSVDISIAANPLKSYEGKIKRIAPFATTKNGVKVFETEVHLDEADRKLRPGMSAVVKVNIRAKTGVLAIPVTALFVEDKSEYVFSEDEEGNLIKKSVKRGINDENNIEVMSGLTKEDKIYSDIPYDRLLNEEVFIPKKESDTSEKRERRTPSSRM